MNDDVLYFIFTVSILDPEMGDSIYVWVQSDGANLFLIKSLLYGLPFDDVLAIIQYAMAMVTTL